MTTGPTSETYHVDWDTETVPGVPLMVLIITTKGAAPLYLPALTTVDPEYQPQVAEQIAQLFRETADQMTADLALFRAVDDAMTSRQGGDDR